MDSTTAQGRERVTDTPELALLLRAVAEPQRLELMRALADEPRSVGELVESSGLAQASVSHHLAVLRRSGLVAAVREGRQQLHAWGRPDPASAAAALLAWLHVWLGPQNAAARPATIGNPVRPRAYPRAHPSQLEDHLL